MITIKDEKVFISKKRIKYLFKEGKNREKLIIIFSGYLTSENMKAAYNYINVLNDIKCSRLYILDDYGYDNRGCWYLCENFDFSVENSIVELINSIKHKYDISNKNIIVGGSSKGGYAAIYYGLKYFFGHIIAGAPQIFLSTYLEKKPQILEGIIGDITEQKKNYLDNLITNLEKKNTNIHIFCGKSDGHLGVHVIPFLEMINFEESNVELELLSGNHNTFIPEFSKKFYKKINTILDDKEFNYLTENDYKKVIDRIKVGNIEFDTKSITINIIEDTLQIICKVDNLAIMYACYLIKNSITVEKRMYQNDNIFLFKLNGDGEYRVQFFIRDIYGDRKSIVVNI